MEIKELMMILHDVINEIIVSDDKTNENLTLLMNNLRKQINKDN